MQEEEEVREIIKKWKKEKIAYAEFNFSCGGDSMDDTSISFYKNKKDFTTIEEESGLTEYFDSKVYDEIEFYEASDGHYLGESGKVIIELNDEENDFTYSKISQSEWSEWYSGEKLCEVTNEQADFLTEYIGGMSHNSWDAKNTDYKKDFILTEEIEEMINELHENFQDCANDWRPINANGEVGDTINYSTANQNIGEIDLMILKEKGKLYVKLYVSCEVYEVRDE